MENKERMAELAAEKKVHLQKKLREEVCEGGGGGGGGKDVVGDLPPTVTNLVPISASPAPPPPLPASRCGSAHTTPHHTTPHHTTPQEAKLQKLRRTSIEDGGLQFVAKAALKCAPFKPEPSNAALTVPQTPKFNVTAPRALAVAAAEAEAEQSFRAKPMPNFGECLSPGRVPVGGEI